MTIARSIFTYPPVDRFHPEPVEGWLIMLRQARHEVWNRWLSLGQMMKIYNTAFFAENWFHNCPRAPASIQLRIAERVMSNAEAS
jgi:hypothetical protein